MLTNSIEETIEETINKAHETTKKCFYKAFVDSVIEFINRVHGDLQDTSDIFVAWYDLYCQDPDIALKALFYLRSSDCQFNNQFVFISLLKHISDTEIELCTDIIRSGLIEKYADTDDLIMLLSNEDDEIDFRIIQHLVKLIILELNKWNIYRSEDYSMTRLTKLIGYLDISLVHKYLSKYYGILPSEFESIDDCKVDEIDIYDINKLDSIDIDKEFFTKESFGVDSKR